MGTGVGVFIVMCLCVVLTSADSTPEQVHIAYGEDESKMTITWSTFIDAASFVLYGLSPKGLTLLQKGVSTKFTDGGSEHRVQFIHRVQLPNLLPNTTYFYIVGSADGWSSQFRFKTMPSGQDWIPRLAVFGDLGSDNAQSLPRLQEDAKANMYDAFIHVGDFAYDMDTDNARVGDQFMRQIEVLAANFPYMTCAGNHEYAYNYSNYKARFSMPNDNGKMYFSFNMGPVHFISINTEFFYFLEYGTQQIYNQYNWLKEDLQEANKQENREKRPWIILFGHRPMYCSNNDGDDCTKLNDVVRTGNPDKNITGLETLITEQGVDLAIWAHEHSYERLWPVYDTVVKNGSYEEPYRNPGAVTHVITGSAGCREDHEYFEDNPPAWSAFRNSDYGYARLTILNSTHLFMEQVSDDQNGIVLDKFTLIREKHGPYDTSKKRFWKKHNLLYN